MNSHCILCRDTSGRPLFVKGGKTFLQCRRCGMVWVDPMPHRHDVGTYQEESYRSGTYTGYAEATDIRDLIAEHRLDAVRPLARPGRWLDVGCATGQFVAVAQRAGMRAEGLDVSATAVAQARARGITAHVAYVEEFEPTAPYDTITAFDIIEHTCDPAGFLARLRSWLVPDGILALTLPNVDSIYPRLLMRRHWFYYAPNDHLFYFNVRALARLLAREGFDVQSCKRAYKPLTLDYVVQQLRVFNPRIGRVAQIATRPLSRATRVRPRRCYLGEMLVIAVRRATDSARRDDAVECPR